MNNVLTETNFRFSNQQGLYKGKVRDVYNIGNQYLVMVASDRISAFDVVLPKGIPYKGQVLNQIAEHFLDATGDIVPNWKIASPDPCVTVGYKAEPFAVEMVIRGYLTGHAWREYKSGKRQLCGVALPEGLKEHDRFPKPIITPTTKAKEGHDMDISRDQILAQGIVSKNDYEQIEHYTYQLFERGSQIALQRGLLLVDTKYEFGKIGDKVVLIDEIHTPDSSRYFYADGYQQRQQQGEAQRQLSKEFVREWLIANGFQGKEGQTPPFMSDEFVQQVSERYIELYQHITGNAFERADVADVQTRIENNINRFLSQLK